MIKLSDVDIDKLSIGTVVRSALNTEGKITNIILEKNNGINNQIPVRFDTIVIQWSHGKTSTVFHHQADSVSCEFFTE